MLFRRGRRSYLRTVFLGIIAMGVLLWASVYRFNVPGDVLWEYFVATLLVLGATILCAALVALALLGIRHLLRRAGQDS